MTCEFCRRTQDDGFRTEKCAGIDFVERCPRGEIPKLLLVNKDFTFLLFRILPGLIDGMGGFKYESIQVIMEEYDVPKGMRPIIFDKCIVVIAAIKEMRDKNKT